MSTFALPDRYPGFSFTLTHQATDSRARLGRLETPHGGIETPAFIFCATKAAMKAATAAQVKAAGSQIILSNTYHLMLQPGAETVARLGGLHRFMAWDGPMLTDSGGFQIFSLGHGGVAQEIKGSRLAPDRSKSLLKITEEGAAFRSHIDGSRHLLTPEGSVAVQRRLGADIILVLDECTPYNVDKAYTARSMAMTHRWADRCLAAFEQPLEGYGPGEGSAGAQALYGISQGGVYPDLRAETADFLLSRPFFGHAVGGSLGGDKEEMYRVVADAMKPLHAEKPVHLLGIGGVMDIFSGVELGIDTFDCVAPTRMARHGWALVPAALLDSPPSRAGLDPRLNLRNACHKEDPEPLEPGCPCEACQTVSRGYLHHLLKAEEMLGLTLLTLHNISFINRLMAAVRAGIVAGNLPEMRRYWAGS